METTKRQKFPFTNWELIEKVGAIVGQYEDPLTLRQIYYRLVSVGLENEKRRYKSLSNKLARAREDGQLSWDCMIDRIRTEDSVSSWPSPQDFFKTVRNAYHRDLSLGQPINMEIWCEKAIAVSRIAYKYNIPLYSGGGYRSVSFSHEAAERIRGKNTVIFYIGDFDPSGLDIERDVEVKLKKYGAIARVERVLLTWEQVQKYRLQPSFVKPKDSRASKFVKLYGPNVYELDALPPDVLNETLEASILRHLDKEEYERQKEYEIADKSQILNFLKTWEGGQNGKY